MPILILSAVLCLVVGVAAVYALDQTIETFGLAEKIFLPESANHIGSPTPSTSNMSSLLPPLPLPASLISAHDERAKKLKTALLISLALAGELDARYCH